MAVWDLATSESLPEKLNFSVSVYFAVDGMGGSVTHYWPEAVVDGRSRNDQAMINPMNVMFGLDYILTG